MAYRLSAGGSLTDEIKRVASEEFSTAISSLGPKVKERHEGIHEARKSVKKLRALLRLIQPHLSQTAFQNLNHGLRDTARTLSNLRDAEAMREAFNELLKSESVDSETVDAVRQRLETAAHQAEERAHPDVALPAAAKELRQMQAQWRRLSLPPTSGFSLLQPGLKKIYKRGRKAMLRAEREGTPESFHEWRKRVKDHWYHVRLLDSAENKVWQQRLEDLKELEKLLGDDHNLTLIHDATGDRDKVVRSVVKILKDRSRKLQDKASAIGEHLYSGKWSRVMEHLPEAERLWREQPVRKRPAKAPSKRTAAKTSSAVA